MSPEQRETARRAFVAALDHGLHDFLFALGEAHDQGDGVVVSVDGQDVAEQSDGLNGELFGAAGWFSKYSRHGQAPE